MQDGKDETVLKLNLEEAEGLSADMVNAMENYQQRKHIRID